MRLEWLDGGMYDLTWTEWADKSGVAVGTLVDRYHRGNRDKDLFRQVMRVNGSSTNGKGQTAVFMGKERTEVSTTWVQILRDAGVEFGDSTFKKRRQELGIQAAIDYVCRDFHPELIKDFIFNPRNSAAIQQLKEAYNEI